MFANNLPNDIDDKCVFALLVNKSRRFVSAKDGRSWSNVRESKRPNFSGDRWTNTGRGSFECHNLQSPDLMQYNKINRRPFTPKGAIVLWVQEISVRQLKYGNF